MEITLRQYQPSDVDDFMDWARGEDVIHYTTLRNFSSREDALDYLTKEAIPQPYCRAICLSGRPVGLISFMPGTGPSNRCKGQLRYAIGSQYFGLGIATTAVKMVVPVVFMEFPDVERVEAMVDVDYRPSQRVLEKAGFVKEGVLRKFIVFKGKVMDVVLYSVVSSDPSVAVASSCRDQLIN